MSHCSEEDMPEIRDDSMATQKGLHALVLKFLSSLFFAITFHIIEYSFHFFSLGYI